MIAGFPRWEKRLPQLPAGAEYEAKASPLLATYLVILGAVLLSLALVWVAHKEYERDRAKHVEASRASAGAAARLAQALDQQRLEIQRLTLARAGGLAGSGAPALAPLLATLRQRFPEAFALDLLDADGRPLAQAGPAVSGVRPETVRRVVAAGQSSVFLDLADPAPHYELLVPVSLAEGAGALRLFVADSALASPLEWFEPTGHRLYLVHVGEPQQPLLAAQRPFDLNRGMPATPIVSPLAGASVAVAGTDWTVIAVPEAASRQDDPTRHVVLVLAGLLLLWSFAWLAVERLRGDDDRRRERAAAEQRYLTHLEREVDAQTRDLKASRSRLEEAQRIARVGSFEFDAEANRWSASTVLDDVLGITALHPRDRAGWLALVASADQGAVAEALAACLADGAPWDQLYRIVRPADGGERWVHVRGELQRENGNDRGRLIGTLQDITLLKAAEDALRDSESRANLILDTVPEGILVVAASGRIVRTNPECERMFRYRAGELLGQPVETLLPAALRHHHRHLRAGFEMHGGPRLMGQGRHLKALRRDGSEFHVEVGLGPVVIAGEPHVIVIVSDISARIAAELDLRRFREILDTSGDLLAFIDTDLCYGIVNPAYAAQFARTPAEIHGRPLAEAMSPALYAEVAPYMRRALAGETIAYVTSRSDPSGGVRLYEAEYRPFETVAGIEGVVASLHDVTRRVESEAALRDSELKARAMLNTPFINLGLLDAQGRIELINDTALRAVNARLEDLVGRPFWEGPWYAHDEGVRQRVRQAIEEACGGHFSRFEMTSSLASGEVRYKDFIVQPIGDALRPIAWITIQSIDITDRVLARRSLEAQQEKLEAMVAARTAELAQSEDKFRGLVEQSMVGIYIICEGRFVYVNPGQARMFGFDSPQEMQSSISVLDMVAPEHRDRVLTRIRERVERTQTQANYSFTAVRKDGSRFEIEVQGRSFEYDGKPAVIGIATDITERRQMEVAREASLAEARRLAAARSEFLANMSHEIRTPLNAVLGLAQVGLRDSRGRQICGTFRRILDSGQTLLAVVNDILDYSKIEAGKLSLERAPFTLGEVIDRAVAIVAPAAYGKGLDLRVEEAVGLPSRFLGDSVRITQVLLNLLSNAVKFTQSGRVSVGVTRDGETLCLAISDTGIGIPSAEIGRLFLPFEQADGSTTRRFGGTGLGLSIVHSLVRLMGGDIQVISDAGEGSRFEVRLPLPEATDGSAPDTAIEVRLVGLAEAEDLARRLAAHGHRARVASLEEAFAADADLILVDGEAVAEPSASRTLLARGADAGPALALVATPGRRELPSVLRERFALIDRPLHPRGVLAALAAGAADHAAGVGEARLAGISILAAEDNEVNRLVLEEMLVAEGARLVLAEDGQVALDILAREGATAFQIVVTDIQMPVLDGYALARRLREIAPQLPVVGLTAHAMPEERARCLAAGMVERLTKPVDLEILVSTLRNLVLAPGETPVAQPSAAPAAPSPAPESGAATTRLIDWNALETRFRGKSAFVERLLAQFVATYADSPATLRRLAEMEDFDNLSFQAHTLKGVFGNLLISDAVQQAAHTDRLARARDATALAEAQTLAALVERLLDEARRQVPAAVDSP